MGKIKHTRFGLIALAVPMIFGLAGCRGVDAEEGETIYIAPFSRSGFGSSYITEIFNDWKRETGSQFKMEIVDDCRDSGSVLVKKIREKNETSDIYLSGIPSFNQGFYDNPPILEDLTPLLDERPEGKLTIREKIVDFDSWKKSSSKLTWNSDDSISYGSTYVLPFTRTFTGFIFDYKKFVDEGFLIPADPTDNSVLEKLSSQQISYHVGIKKGFDNEVLIFDSSRSSEYCNYKTGDVITSAGKDGKFGTYDDGQPETWEDFDKMVSMIMGSGYNPFVFSKTANECYLQELVEEIFTQEAGLDSYYALSSFDSRNKPIKMDDQTSEIINWKNAYKVYNSSFINEKLAFALEKAKKYALDGRGQMYYETTSVVDAQSRFITGGIKSEDFCGMLYEGNWFENQAKTKLNSAGETQAGRGYGQVDYRFMLLPNSKDALGLDGKGHGSVLTAPETGGIVVRKQSDDNPAKKEAIFSFIKYMLRDSSMSKITRSCGLIMGYKYAISSAELAQTTPFIRNCYQLYQDTENVKCTAVATDILSHPFSCLDDTGKFKTEDSSILSYPLNATNIISAYFAMAFNGASISSICEKFKNRYSESDWNQIYTTMKNKLSK